MKHDMWNSHRADNQLYFFLFTGGWAYSWAGARGEGGGLLGLLLRPSLQKAETKNAQHLFQNWKTRARDLYYTENLEMIKPYKKNRSSRYNKRNSSPH